MVHGEPGRSLQRVDLDVANFIVLGVSGRDSQDVASQFENTPPPAEIKLEPVYQSVEDLYAPELHHARVVLLNRR